MTDQAAGGTPADAVPDETDLIVVGAGSAGAATAISARDLGAEVVLLEKSAEPGGNSRYSGGNLIELAGPAGLSHLEALAFGRTPVPVLAAYADALPAVRGWLEKLGASTYATGPAQLEVCWPNLAGADAVRFYRVDGLEGPGRSLWRVLAAALAEREVRPFCAARVTELVTRQGRITGVRAEIGGDTKEIRARAGVVLAAGGFAGSPQLCDIYLPVGSLQAVSHPANTGDGLLLAQAAGASLWHMSNFTGFWSFRAAGQPAALGIIPAGPGYLIVDSDGRRFAAEAGRETHDRLRALGDFSPARQHAPGFPVHLIFDEATLHAGPLSGFRSPSGYQWSKDNSAELKAGWIARAATVADLAGHLGVAPGVLADTVAAFNSAAASGRDAEFGRPASTMRPLTDGPLYTIPLLPGVATTSGGPRRDDKARVLGTSGDPVPGLYAAGDCGSVWGHLLEHGLSLTDGLVFGPIAAADALGRLQEATRTGRASGRE